MRGTPPIRFRESIRRSGICRCTPDTCPARIAAPSQSTHASGHFVQVATTVVPFITDHLLSPAVRMRKQLALEPFQVVQKPSLVSFQVPWPLAPEVAIGSRVILPSAVNTILNLTFEGVEEVNGWPVKKVAWISLGASTAAEAGAIEVAMAATATTPARSK